MLPRRDRFPVLGPTLAAARRAAQFLAGHGVATEGPVTPGTIGLAASGVLLAVPPGTAGIAFVRRCLEEILLPYPPADLAAAIAGIAPREQHPPSLPEIGRRRDRLAKFASGILLEGTVDAGRVEAVLAQGNPPRLWIVERFDRIAIGRADRARLARRRIVWAALRPVCAVGAVLLGPNTPALRDIRRAFSRNLPIWKIPGGTGLASGKNRRTDRGRRTGNK
jgi:hypothetical protein